MHLGVGNATIKHRRLRIVGIYHIGVAFQDTGAFIPLATAQAIAAVRARRPRSRSSSARHPPRAAKRPSSAGSPA